MDDLFELVLDYDNAVLEVRSRGIDLEGLLLQACNQWSLQKALVKALKLKNVTPYCPILRLQDKFDRWRLSERGNIACRRAFAMSSAHLKTFTPCSCHCYFARLVQWLANRA